MANWRKRLILALFAVAGPLFLVGSIREYLHDRDVAEHGKAATANLLAAELERGHRGADRYRLQLEYAPDQADPQRVPLYVSPREYKRLAGARQVPIRYLPGDPSNVLLASGSSDAPLGIALGATMTLIGWAPLAGRLRRRAVVSAPT